MRYIRTAWPIVVVLLTASSSLGQGIIVSGAGPINQSMAGASTAAPVDFGSSYWNPATISGLDRPQFLLGSALVLPSTHFTSSLPAGSINGIFPPNNRFGTSRSDSGVIPGLATGTAFRLSDDSPWTLGLGVFGLAFGNVNFPGSSAVPILAPRIPPRFFGFGPIFGSATLLAIDPMASYRFSDRLSIGGGPVITAGNVSLSPAFFAPGPKDAFGIPTFPAATNARPFWGGGFQLGLLYELNENWNLGFSYKSPIWQERWSFNAANPDLSPRRIGVQAQIPAIYSWGVAYKGIERALVDVDLRYIDYANAALFGQRVVDGGLGWHSVFAVALGGQYALTDRLTLRAGYLFNTNPIPSEATLFNVQLPVITQHTLSLGLSLALTEDIMFTAGWVHGFRNAIQGSVREEPGAFTRLDTQYDALLAGFNIQFGHSRKAIASCANCEPVAAGP